MYFFIARAKIAVRNVSTVDDVSLHKWKDISWESDNLYQTIDM